MKLFVWDFHGVLEKNTIFAAKEITNRVLEEFNIPNRLTDEDTERLYGQQWIDYFREFAPDSPNEDHEKMNERAYEISNKEQVFRKYIQPQDHAKEVLTKIKNSGAINLLISNSSQKSIDIFADAVNLTNYFHNIIGVDNYTIRITKAQAIKDYIKDKDISKIIVIGDHPHDILTGHEVQATTYLFSRNGKFPKANANYEITNLKEILKEI